MSKEELETQMNCYFVNMLGFLPALEHVMETKFQKTQLACGQVCDKNVHAGIYQITLSLPGCSYYTRHWVTEAKGPAVSLMSPVCSLWVCKQEVQQRAKQPTLFKHSLSLFHSCIGMVAQRSRIHLPVQDTQV